MKRGKKKFILFINTVVFGEILVGLFGGESVMQKKIKGNSDKLLVLIDKILEKNKIKPEDINGIAVVSGPGSFTAVRQGVLAANALGFFLRIPVAGIRLDEFKGDNELIAIIEGRMKKTRVGETVLPFYGGEPNITKPRDTSPPVGGSG
jgi:tRNA A37 threonylcarbamoyladenosine modification protein TsaB